MKKLICFLLPLLILVSCQSGPEPLVASKVDLIPSVYPISSAIEPGPTETGLYRTVTPFEHANVGRTHVYPADFGGSLSVPESNAVVVRQFSGVHETPYNIVTRNRDELFLFGGTQGRRDDAKGPYVVKFDATTGQVVWRTDLRDTKALVWLQSMEMETSTPSTVYALSGSTQQPGRCGAKSNCPHPMVSHLRTSPTTVSACYAPVSSSPNLLVGEGRRVQASRHPSWLR